MLYPIAIIEKDGKYYGRLPDIPELEITGSNMADIISIARSEVINHLQMLAEDNQPLPKDSEVSTHLTSGEYAGWTWAIVNIESSRIIGEDVSLTLNIPERLMKKLIRSNDNSDHDIEAYVINILREAVQDD